MNDQMKKSILVVAGEASGDLHGACVVREILKRDPAIHIYGVGGIELEKAGMHVIARSCDLAVTGFFEIFFKIKKIWLVFRTLIRSVAERQPSLVLLIDYPDFNLRLAKRLHKKGIPIVYYISPQVWAWRRYRVRYIKKWVSKMLVVFPFELSFYRSLGIQSDFVGHPLLDCIQPRYSLPYAKRYFELASGKKTIALMPGSRKNELRYHLKPILKAAEKIHSQFSQVQFLLPVASTVNEEEVRQSVKKVNVPIKVVNGETYDVLSASDIVICCSGTSTLESAILGKPMVVVLKLSYLTFFLGSFFIHGGMQFFALPNLIAARKIVPELIQSDVTSANIASEVLRYLKNPDYLEKTSEELLKVRKQLGNPGAAQRIAEQVFYYLNQKVQPFVDLKSQYGYLHHWLCVLPYVGARWWITKCLYAVLFPFLWAASHVYGFIIKVRQYLYMVKFFRPERIPVKVVSVGNITVGGTGKTPLTIYLAKELQKQGKRVAILSRGYKRQQKNAWDCVADGKSIQLSVRESGDEPMLMAQKLGEIPIYVGAKRFRVAREILKRHKLDVLLLDDGFQHWKLDRDLDFVMLDVTSFGEKNRLLPLGRFREPLTHIKRCNCIVLMRTDHIDELEKERIKRRLCIIHPNVPIVEANYQPRYLEHIISKRVILLEAFSGKRVFVFAGIGNPYSFKKVIERLNGEIVEFKTFSDHFFYTQKHIRNILKKAQDRKVDFILTTEKDAVRIPQNGMNLEKFPIYSLVVDLKITSGQKTFDSILNTI